jgi:hypothetical protein
VAFITGWTPPKLQENLLPDLITRVQNIAFNQKSGIQSGKKNPQRVLAFVWEPPSPTHRDFCKGLIYGARPPCCKNLNTLGFGIEHNSQFEQAVRCFVKASANETTKYTTTYELYIYINRHILMCVPCMIRRSRNDQQYALILLLLYCIYWLLHLSAVACHHQGAS